MEPTNNIDLDRFYEPAVTFTDFKEIVGHRAFRIGYQARAYGLAFNPDLFSDEVCQRRYEEGRELASELMNEGGLIDWPLDQNEPPVSIVLAQMGERYA